MKAIHCVYMRVEVEKGDEVVCIDLFGQTHCDLLLRTR